MFLDILIDDGIKFLASFPVQLKLIRLGVPVIPPSGPINFDKYIGRGLQEGEKLLPEEQASEPQVNGAVLNELLLMGFPEIRCKKALIATDNRDAETALNWIFGHMDDPGMYNDMNRPWAMKA
ncbi:7295_t:CDS:2 [Paraglomus brasilianum]|uniref:7295_t:CDS:1 n=1 Tax=Paraglomus brasilianum TaxID=144538 RepID=A0A9N8Z8V2_9GLOM|nr:7295_t:CDS:2 [Paraglomus brasilianum]